MLSSSDLIRFCLFRQSDGQLIALHGESRRLDSTEQADTVRASLMGPVEVRARARAPDFSFHLIPLQHPPREMCARF